jgi:L,D-transpeptidase YbiS
VTKEKIWPWAAFGVLGLILMAGTAMIFIRTGRVRSERQDLMAASEWPSLKELKLRNKQLTGQLRRTGPSGVCIIIDTGRNILTLKRADKVMRQAVISSGSGNILEDPAGKRSWFFDTPRGVFSVKAMIRDPYWIKPDWAFIEEDKPLPKRLDERIEGGVLGEYALSFGNGYFIHGTLYTRMLGRNVTHGCIRVGDADLEAVFSASSVGTRIFVF